MENMELQELRDCLDRILKLDGGAFFQVLGCCNDKEKDKFFGSYYASYFDNPLVERSKDRRIVKVTCDRINVDCKPNICELLDNIDRGDILSDMLFHTIEYNNEYNKSPLYLTPFYRLKEEVDNVWEDAQARKAKEEAERKAKEEAERNSYKSLIEEFVSDTKECEYKDGIIFGKKKTIRYVATPITKHIWNAVVNKSAERDFDDDEYVPQKELGDFIKELNAHFEGSVVFEYLHKNIHASVHLQVYEKLDKNACFVYIKEDNR